jgi:hypothetical protein
MNRQNIPKKLKDDSKMEFCLWQIIIQNDFRIIVVMITTIDPI